MKKLTLFLSVFLSLQVHADYTPGPVIKVIIPNGPSSGLATLYRNMEVHAAKNNITMIPVYAPGAESKIGSRQAEAAGKDTLFLSVISDVAQHSDLTKLEPVSAIAKASMSLAVSKKSKLSTMDDIVREEKSSPGKLNWLYVSSAHRSMINALADDSGIDKSKLTLIPVTIKTSGPIQLIMSGDADVSFISSDIVKKLSLDNKMTEIELKSKTKLAVDSKAIATALFLANDHDTAAVKFWIKFVEDLNNSDAMEAKRLLDGSKSLPLGPGNLINMLNNWKSQ